jgi:hypothetical protein
MYVGHHQMCESVIEYFLRLSSKWDCCHVLVSTMMQLPVNTTHISNAMMDAEDFIYSDTVCMMASYICNMAAPCILAAYYIYQSLLAPYTIQEFLMACGSMCVIPILCNVFVMIELRLMFFLCVIYRCLAPW